MMQAIPNEAGQGLEPRDGRWTFDADKERVRRAMGIAFAGTDMARGEPTLAWGLSHVSFPSEEERLQLFRFLMSFPLYEDWKQTSFQLCGQTLDGEIMSIASVQEYDTNVRARKPFKKFRYCWNHYATIMKLICLDKEDVPGLFLARKHKEDRKRFYGKMGQFFENAEEWHHTYGPKGTHWFVHLIGVNPAYHRQGRGRELVQKLNQTADKANQAMYLEAGEDNRGFYEKMGFSVTRTQVLEDPSKKDKPFQLHLMIREPKKEIVAP